MLSRYHSSAKVPTKRPQVFLYTVVSRWFITLAHHLQFKGTVAKDNYIISR
jgi:hypothetical protein